MKCDMCSCSMGDFGGGGDVRGLGDRWIWGLGDSVV